MAVPKLLAFLFLAVLVSASARDMPSAEQLIDGGMPLIHAPRPWMGSAGDLGRRGGGVTSCERWRLAVEANTLRDWKTIPAQCEKYVGNYMMGGRYRSDSRAVINKAIAYADGLKLSGNGNEVWVFDVDETVLSNLPYYANHRFGAEPYDWKAFGAYVKEASAPALPETMRLYKRLQALGIKPVILTGRREGKRESTEKNLARAGYTGYLKLLHKPQDANVNTVQFKSGERKKLEDAGYVIVGNIGDQWCDILGTPEGKRTFKLPNPMYYVG